jgi:hypothetical protein
MANGARTRWPGRQVGNAITVFNARWGHAVTETESDGNVHLGM